MCFELVTDREDQSTFRSCLLALARYAPLNVMCKVADKVILPACDSIPEVTVKLYLILNLVISRGAQAVLGVITAPLYKMIVSYTPECGNYSGRWGGHVPTIFHLASFTPQKPDLYISIIKSYPLSIRISHTLLIKLLGFTLSYFNCFSVASADNSAGQF